MASRDQHGGSAHIVNAACRVLQILAGFDPLSAERFGLGNVRRDDMRERQQFGTQHLHAVIVEQAISARRCEYRIDDDEGQFELFDRGGDGLDDRGVAEHARLCGVRLDVAGNGLNLRRHQIRRQRLRLDDPHRALRGDGGRHAEAVHAQRGERLQIGLQAGAAARVASRNRQRDAHVLVKISEGAGPRGPCPG